MIKHLTRHVPAGVFGLLALACMVPLGATIVSGAGTIVTVAAYVLCANVVGDSLSQ